MKIRYGWRGIRCLGWGQSEFGDERGETNGQLHVLPTTLQAACNHRPKVAAPGADEGRGFLRTHLLEGARCFLSDPSAREAGVSLRSL